VTSAGFDLQVAQLSVVGKHDAGTSKQAESRRAFGLKAQRISKKPAEFKFGNLSYVRRQHEKQTVSSLGFL
jgi:hypothetical protein